MQMHLKRELPAKYVECFVSASEHVLLMRLAGFINDGKHTITYRIHIHSSAWIGCKSEWILHNDVTHHRAVIRCVIQTRHHHPLLMASNVVRIYTRLCELRTQSPGRQFATHSWKHPNRETTSTTPIDRVILATMTDHNCWHPYQPRCVYRNPPQNTHKYQQQIVFLVLRCRYHVVNVADIVGQHQPHWATQTPAYISVQNVTSKTVLSTQHATQYCTIRISTSLSVRWRPGHVIVCTSGHGRPNGCRRHTHTVSANSSCAKTNEPTINWTNHVYRICSVCIV